MSQLAMLFGSLFFAAELFEYRIQPSLITLSIAAGINLISRNKLLMWFFIALFLIALFLFGSNFFIKSESTDNLLLRVAIYLLFSTVISISLIQQVWKASFVNKNVIMGLVSGYISLGFVSFFLFMLIEIINPGAFKGILLDTDNLMIRADSIMYYAFITLLTIGYGEIVPVIPVAQKAAIFTGLAGQFYLIIITTVVLEKYIRHSINKA
ncbi:MAG TPA: ion channel [Cyclobacteriaceae bacterium]